MKISEENRIYIVKGVECTKAMKGHEHFFHEETVISNFSNLCSWIQNLTSHITFFFRTDKSNLRIDTLFSLTFDLK